MRSFVIFKGCPPPLNSCKMGASHAKVSCGGVEVEEPLATRSKIVRPTCRYSLEFTAEVMRWDRWKSVKRRHVEQSRVMLGSEYFWSEWLSSSMRDAVEDDFEKTLGLQDIRFETLPPIFDIDVELDPISKKKRNEITGVISWRSLKVDEGMLEEAIEWRLGDRLSHYGICDERERWSCFFHPGTLVSE